MRFSVIVPVYGIEDYIHKCVDSILAQTYTDFELILVDDGSKDNCPAICDEYANKDSRVHVIHKENGRLVSTRNAGIKAAVGDYICYVDGDDWVTENWLEVINNCIETAPAQPDIVAFDSIKVFNDHTAPVIRTIPAGFYNKKRMEAEVYPYLISDRRHHVGTPGIYTSSWNKAYKRELLSAHHCMNEKITRGEDTSFTIEVFLYSDNIVITDEVLYYYNRQNVKSNLMVYDTKRVYAYSLLFEYVDSHIVGLYDSIDAQMNDFYASYCASVVSHDVEHHLNIFKSARNIRKQFHEIDLTKRVKLKGLPFSAWLVIFLLKTHMYFFALLGTKIYLSIRYGH